MKPKSKLQHQVSVLHEQLPDVTKKQAKWAYDNCLNYYAMISRNRMYCLECNHKWDPGSALITEAQQPQKNGPDLKIKCPGCKRKLIVLHYNQTHTSAVSFWSVWTTFKDFQVIRIFHVHKNMAKTKKPWWHTCENIQYWIGKDGSITTFSRISNNYYGGPSGFQGEISLRPTGTENEDRYNLHLDDEVIYPVKNLLPEITRNGFNGTFHGLSPQQMFAFLLNGVYGETLLKTKQIFLFKYFAKNRLEINNKIWTAVKIAIRHKYKFTEKNISDWVDYIKLLVYFKKDIHNPVYVCPEDLHTAHNRLVQKKRRIQQQKDFLKTVKEIEADEPGFKKRNEKFFGLCFTGKKGLVITTIKTVRQVMEEGDFLNHCVFTNRYHRKAESLLLTASIEDVVMETIEVDLRSFKISQARGRKNLPSPYNKEIIALVEKNLGLIREAMTAKKYNSKPQPQESAAA